MTTYCITNIYIYTVDICWWSHSARNGCRNGEFLRVLYGSVMFWDRCDVDNLGAVDATSHAIVAGGRRPLVQR